MKQEATEVPHARHRLNPGLKAGSASKQVFAGANGFEWAQPTPTEENCGRPPRHGRSSFWGLGGARTRPRRRAGFGLSAHNTPQTALKQTTNDFHPNPRENG